MPRALRVCTTSTCTELTKSGKCTECRRKAARARNAVTSHDYDARWRAFSAAFLKRYPHCFDCGSEGKHVDHADGLGPSGPRGFDWSNLRTLCISCHSRKTVKHDGGFGRYAADGKPLDG